MFPEWKEEPVTHLLTKPGDFEKAEGRFGQIAHAHVKLEVFIGRSVT